MNIVKKKLAWENDKGKTLMFFGNAVFYFVDRTSNC